MFDEDAYSAGYDAFNSANGSGAMNPYPLSWPEYRLWQQGYEDAKYDAGL